METRIINFLREETKNLWIKGCIFEQEEKNGDVFVLLFYPFNSKSIIFTYYIYIENVVSYNRKTHRYNKFSSSRKRRDHWCSRI